MTSRPPADLGLADEGVDGMQRLTPGGWDDNYGTEEIDMEPS
jgi:hypothetical protein